jgi:hypothetical protein
MRSTKTLLPDEVLEKKETVLALRSFLSDDGTVGI